MHKWKMLKRKTTCEPAIWSRKGTSEKGWQHFLGKYAQNTAMFSLETNLRSTQSASMTNKRMSTTFAIRNICWSDYVQCTVMLTESWSSPTRFSATQEICFPLSSDEILVILKEPCVLLVSFYKWIKRQK
jgi:hypothetical protein